MYEKLLRWVMMQLSEKPMSLNELTAKTRGEDKRVYRAISLLHRDNRIVHFRDVDGTRRYKPIEEKNKD